MLKKVRRECPLVSYRVELRGGGEPEGRLGSVPSVERPGAQVPEGEDGRMCSLGTPWDTLMFI